MLDYNGNGRIDPVDIGISLAADCPVSDKSERNSKKSFLINMLLQLSENYKRLNKKHGKPWKFVPDKMSMDP